MTPPRPHPRWPGIAAGALAALAFLFVVSIPFLFVWAWSGAHCEPKPDCRSFANRAVLVEMAVILGLSVLTGASVRAMVDWGIRRHRGERRARAPRWAVVCLLLLGLLMLWTGTSLFGF